MKTMKRILFLSTLVGMILLLGMNTHCTMTTARPSPGSSGIPVPGIDDRIANQHDRINQGIRSGELTQAEVRLLQDNLNYIQQTEARFKADGRLTQEEIDRLHRMLDQNSDMIYDKTHNPARAFRPGTNESVPYWALEQQKRIDGLWNAGEYTDDQLNIFKDNLNFLRQIEAQMTSEGRFFQESRQRLDNAIRQNNEMMSHRAPMKALRPAPDSPTLQERISNQQKRIEQGILSGELTRGEVTLLEGNLNEIRQEESRLRKRTGSLTQEAWEWLQWMLDENSEMILNKKHNPVKRLY